MATIVLTFDDNKWNHYRTVYPLLKKYGLTATFAYVTKSHFTVEEDNESAIREMVEYGIDITSHSHTHLKFEGFRKHSIDELRNDTSASIKKLEDLGISPIGMIMPYNYLRNKTIFQGIDFKYVVYKSTRVGSFPRNQEDRKVPKLNELSKFNFLRLHYPFDTCPESDTAKFYRILKALREDEVLGITFHNVSDQQIASNVKIDKFEELLKFLVENEYSVVTLKSLYS